MIQTLFICGLFFSLLFLISYAVGQYVVWVFDFDKASTSHLSLLRIRTAIEMRFEKVFSRIAIVDMTWKQYASALGVFYVILFIGLYSLLYFSPFFMTDQPSFSALEALQIAISFITGTNWQSYIPEKMMTETLQLYVILPIMFLAPATALIVAWCLMKSLVRTDNAGKIGNFYLDLFRAVVFLLLPLTSLATLVLMVGGIHEYPLAVFAAIQNLGSNGGGFFNANCAHPLVNPSPFTHIFYLFLIFVLPASVLMAFGIYSKNIRFSKRVYILFSILFCIALLTLVFSERTGILRSSLDPLLFSNMEGKECRIGSFWSLFWAASTTCTSTGSTAFSLSAFMPLSTTIPLVLMQMGAIFGGVGTGFISLIITALIAVFTSGLMVGRTPELFRKKIIPSDMILVMALFIAPVVLTLAPFGIITLYKEYLYSLASTPERSLTEVLYALTSCVCNNGSAISTIHAENPIFSSLITAIMCSIRMIILIGTISLSGNFIQKQKVYETAGSVKIESVAAIVWIGVTMFILGLLSYLPVDVLGPIFEQISLKHDL